MLCTNAINTSNTIRTQTGAGHYNCVEYYAILVILALLLSEIGRQLVELLCFSGDLPLTDIFLIMCIYWRINWWWWWWWPLRNDLFSVEWDVKRCSICLYLSKLTAHFLLLVAAIATVIAAIAAPCVRNARPTWPRTARKLVSFALRRRCQQRHTSRRPIY